MRREEEEEKEGREGEREIHSQKVTTLESIVCQKVEYLGDEGSVGSWRRRKWQALQSPLDVASNDRQWNYWRRRGEGGVSLNKTHPPYLSLCQE